MEKEQQKILENVWIRFILISFSVILLFVLSYFLRGTLISLFLAFTVAYIFDPIVDFFERRHWPGTGKHIHRGYGIAILIVTVVLVTGGFLSYALPKTVSGIYRVGGMISDRYPLYETAVETWLKKYENTEFAKSIKSLIKERFVPALEYEGKKDTPAGDGVEHSTVTKESGNRTLPGEGTEKESPLQKKRLAEIALGFQKYLPQVMLFFTGIIKNIFYSTFGFVGIILNVIIFSVVSVYLLKDFNNIAGSIKTIFPASKRDYAVGLLAKINDNLRYFLRGQLIICFILSLIYSIGLTIAGVPLAFIIGFIGGFGNLIPYVGTGIGIALASLLAFFQFPDFRHILYVLITFGTGQLLEGTVITPRIMGKGLGLSPVAVILSILICSQLFGFLGLLLAVPIASTIKVFIDELMSRYKSSQYYKGQP
jgi:predicted PurR-regulated permease PerM